MTLLIFQKYRSNFGTRYLQHDTFNFNRVQNGCTMVAKTGTIVLIMKIAYKVEPLPSCCCMIFLTSNDLEGNISAKPTSLTVGYSRTRTRIYKSTAYRRDTASGKTLGGPQVYKYPLAWCQKLDVENWLITCPKPIALVLCCNYTYFTDPLISERSSNQFSSNMRGKKWKIICHLFGCGASFLFWPFRKF